jgi:hypothetical protein
LCHSDSSASAIFFPRERERERDLCGKDGRRAKRLKLRCQTGTRREGSRRSRCTHKGRAVELSKPLAADSRRLGLGTTHFVL